MGGMRGSAGRGGTGEVEGRIIWSAAAEEDDGVCVVGL